MSGNSRNAHRERDITWRSGWRRLQRLWRADTEVNVDDEIQFHFEQKVAEFVEGGMSERDARVRAEEEFGDVATVRRSLTEIDQRVALRNRRAEWWEAVLQDTRYVVRTLVRSPMFAVMVVATMALGLGANAAIFALLDQLYVQAPPGITNPDGMRRLLHSAMNRGEIYERSGFAHVEIRGLRTVAPQGVRIASYTNERVRIGRDANAPLIGASYVEGDYFGVSGVHAALGRTFAPDEYGIAGLSQVAIISHSLWRSQYGGDSAIIGRDLEVGSHRYTIIGVSGEKFRGLDVTVSDVFLPLNSVGLWKGRKAYWYESKNFNGQHAIVRLDNAAAGELFNARATTILRDPVIGLMRDSLSTTALQSIIAARSGRTYKSEMKISTRLGGVAAVILLIACANVINLMLARSAQRRREIAVRLALGVSRFRLLSQLMIESTVLSLVSGAVALTIAYFGANTLRKLLLPDIQWSEGAIDARVVLFTGALAIGTGFLVGLVPAVQATRSELSSALKSSVRDGGQRRSRLRSTLLVTQAALSVVLLVGAGVFVRSLRTVEAVDTGFDIDRLAFATVSYDREIENRSADIQQRMPAVLERIRRVPGVEVVATAGNIPMYGFSFEALFLPGRDSLPPAGNMSRIMNVVSPEYYKAVGMRVIRGREFTAADREGSEPVIAINENMARNFWPGEDALTKCIIVGTRESPCRRVVAIVSPAHFASIIEEPSALYYLPMDQAGENSRIGAIVIRNAPGRTAQVSAMVGKELQSEFGDWARPRVRTMEEIVGPQMRTWRMGAALFTTAGVLALLVAAVGVYSSIAYTISQRTQEMGVRIALGASTASIMRTVANEGVRVVAVGVALGIVAALALGSIVASMLYETSPRDPFVLVVATATLLVVAVLASAIPAWRASRVDPLAALRAE